MGKKSQNITFAASDSWHVSGPGSDVEDDGFLYPGDEEVGTFSNDQILDTLKSVKDDGSVTTINCNCEKKKVNTTFLEVFELSGNIYDYI